MYQRKSESDIWNKVALINESKDGKWLTVFQSPLPGVKQVNSRLRSSISTPTYATSFKSITSSHAPTDIAQHNRYRRCIPLPRALSKENRPDFLISSFMYLLVTSSPNLQDFRVFCVSFREHVSALQVLRCGSVLPFPIFSTCIAPWLLLVSRIIAWHGSWFSLR